MAQVVLVEWRAVPVATRRLVGPAVGARICRWVRRFRPTRATRAAAAAVLAEPVVLAPHATSWSVVRAGIGAVLITGTAPWYAGGGGGQGLQLSGRSAGGVRWFRRGGGGAYSNNNSTWTAGTPPTANRGGGGGGGGQGSPTTAHDGADGIVIIRYII